MAIIDLLKLLRPVTIFVNLINEKMLATLTHKLLGHIYERMRGEINIIRRNIEHLLLTSVLMNIL